MTALQLKPGQSNFTAQTGAAIAIAIGFLVIAGWVVDRPLLASWGPGWIPMPPSTALLFLLLGSAVFCHARTPASRPARLASLAAGSAVALLALGLFILSYQGIYLDAERLGLNTGVTFEDARIGHMSAATALFFLSGGLSLMAWLYSTPDRRWPALAAVLLAGLLLIASVIFLLTYLFGLSPLFAEPFIPPALPTSIAMGALGAALFTLSGSPNRALDHDYSPDAADPRRPRSLVLIFALITGCLFITGGIFFHSLVVQKRNEVDSLLSAIAELKVRDS